MTDKFDFREVDMEDGGSTDELNKDNDVTDITEAEEIESKDSEDDEYEDICFVCRRPESKAGRMFKMPNNICVCDDCMHKTMDAVNQMDYQEMFNDPRFADMEQMFRGGGMPNIKFLNLSKIMHDKNII